MNKRIFNILIKEPGLKQEPWEWKMFLEFCSEWLKNQKIKNPIVVELGILNNKQKAFYEQLFDAEYIGVDMLDDRGKPDILGNTHAPETLAKLMRKLKGRQIDVLFIDASHHYEDAIKDFEIYSPLCSGLVVLHDIETFRNTGRKSAQVWKLWDEIRLGTYASKEEYKQFPLVSIFKRRTRGCQRGIGIIVKK